MTNAKKLEISIFMPVYNGSKYLDRTINSILSQTFKDFELVCLDDSSTDDSYEILRHYQNSDDRIKLFRKPNGGSVPKSWNYILPFLKGNSITYISQDDLLSIDYLEKLHLCQKETGADCVLPDLEWYYENTSLNIRKIGVDGNRDIILSNRDAVLLSLSWSIHGFALWRSEIFKNELFPEESFDSDEFMTRKLFFKSNKVVFCDSVFYYRQDNDQAITKKFGKKNYFRILTDYRLFIFLTDNKFNKDIIDLKLYKIYRYYFRLRILCLLGKGINSKKDQNEIQNMLKVLYKELRKNRFPDINNTKGIKNKLKIFIYKSIFIVINLFQNSISFINKTK